VRKCREKGGNVGKEMRENNVEREDLRKREEMRESIRQCRKKEKICKEIKMRETEKMRRKRKSVKGENAWKCMSSVN
jgi:hypothetical protein